MLAGMNVCMCQVYLSHYPFNHIQYSSKGLNKIVNYEAPLAKKIGVPEN